MNSETNRCFACNRKLGRLPYCADTREDQFVHVGRECYKLIQAAGEMGYQPLNGGPRLYVLTADRLAYFRSKGMLL
jgi:hypothetical protein